MSSAIACSTDVRIGRDERAGRGLTGRARVEPSQQLDSGGAQERCGGAQLGFADLTDLRRRWVARAGVGHLAELSTRRTRDDDLDAIRRPVCDDRPAAERLVVRMGHGEEELHSPGGRMAMSCSAATAVSTTGSGACGTGIVSVAAGSPTVSKKWGVPPFVLPPGEEAMTSTRDLVGQDAERVRHPSGRQREAACSQRGHLATDLDLHLTLEHVEGLLLVVVDVSRRIGRRGDAVLHHAVGAARLGRRRLRQNQAVQEPRRLPFVALSNDRLDHLPSPFHS